MTSAPSAKPQTTLAMRTRDGCKCGKESGLYASNPFVVGQINYAESNRAIRLPLFPTPSMPIHTPDEWLSLCKEENKLQLSFRRHIYRVNNYVVKIDLDASEPDVY